VRGSLRQSLGPVLADSTPGIPGDVQPVDHLHPAHVGLRGHRRTDRLGLLALAVDDQGEAGRVLDLDQQAHRHRRERSGVLGGRNIEAHRTDRASARKRHRDDRLARAVSQHRRDCREEVAGSGCLVNGGHLVLLDVLCI